MPSCWSFPQTNSYPSILSTMPFLNPVDAIINHVSTSSRNPRLAIPLQKNPLLLHFSLPECQPLGSAAPPEIKSRKAFPALGNRQTVVIGMESSNSVIAVLSRFRHADGTGCEYLTLLFARQRGASMAWRQCLNPFRYASPKPRIEPIVAWRRESSDERGTWSVRLP